MERDHAYLLLMVPRQNQTTILISVSDKNKTTKCQEVSRVESLYDSAALHYLSNAQNIDLNQN